MYFVAKPKTRSAFSMEIPRRIVVTGEELPLVWAGCASAAEALRIPPHNLCIMQTLLPKHATIAIVIIRLLLVKPELHGGLYVCITSTVSPVDILAVGSSGVDELAFTWSLLGVVFSVGLQGAVPLEGSNPDLSAGRVVELEEVTRGVLGLRNEGLG